MLKLKHLIPVILLILLSCENKYTKENKATKGIGGVWQDVNSEEFANGYAVFSIEGDSVFVAHYLEHKDRSFFEKGAGIVKGDSIIYHVDVIKAIPEWGSGGGTHYLKLNKNSLKGYYITDSGYKGNLEFKK